MTSGTNIAVGAKYSFAPMFSGVMQLLIRNDTLKNEEPPEIDGVGSTGKYPDVDLQNISFTVGLDFAI